MEKKWLLITVICFSAASPALAVCPSSTFQLSAITTSVSFSSFGDLITGINANAFILRVTAPDASCPWDLMIEDAPMAFPVSITQLSAYTSQGVPLPLSSISISAINSCQTPDQSYGFGIRPPPAVSDNLNTAFTVSSPHYVIGTSAIDGVLLSGTCPALNINDVGNSSTAPTTHLFQFNLKIVPGVSPIIQPGLYRLDMTLALADDATGALLQIQTFSIEIEIQSLLVLNMTSTSAIDFSFNEIQNYTQGITNYGATKLFVKSNVNWDLIAVGTSTRNETTNGTAPFWDNSVSYAASGSANIPLDVLELQQLPANPTAGRSGIGLDYSPALTTPPSGNNNIEVAFGSGVSLTSVAPYTLSKAIAGQWGATGAGHMMAPGSYIDINPGWNRANFAYSINYRLYPGLPVLFSQTKLGAMGTFARPGAYTMEVRFILAEDQ